MAFEGEAFEGMSQKIKRDPRAATMNPHSNQWLEYVGLVLDKQGNLVI